MDIDQPQDGGRYTTDPDIRAEIERACRLCALPELAARIYVRWSLRFTARMGDARWDGLQKIGLIRLSVPLWPKASDAERRETIIHETCHVLANQQARYNVGHGPKWRFMMAACGFPDAKRCHNVDREEIIARRRRTLVSAACACPEGTKLGPTQARRLKAGVVYLCRRCGHHIRPA